MSISKGMQRNLERWRRKDALRALRRAASLASKQTTPRPLPGAIARWPQEVIDAYYAAMRVEYEKHLAALQSGGKVTGIDLASRGGK